jgi:hypothetical protein
VEHSHGDREEDDPAGDLEGANGNREELEDERSRDREDQQDDEGDDGGLFG